MLGLKRGTVELYPHDTRWETAAAQTIAFLKTLLGDTAVDIRHVGSTAIRGICAKPILDIAVAVRSLSEMESLAPMLEEHGVIFRGQDHPGQLLFVMGDFAADTRTHHIHVVLENSTEWHNYNNMRDYLNANPGDAARYDALKRSLHSEYAGDRGKYTSGKSELINELLEKARKWRMEQKG